MLTLSYMLARLMVVCLTAYGAWRLFFIVLDSMATVSRVLS